MQPRTKDTPAAVNRPRKATSILDEKNEAIGERQSGGDNPSKRQKIEAQPQIVGSNISSEEIARRAYLHWESEGRPDGKDIDHWMRAKAEVEQSRP